VAYARPVETQHTFRVLLEAMARPGTAQDLPLTPGEPPVLALLSTLADHEVGFSLLSDAAEHRPSLPALAQRISDLTGCTQCAVGEADFVVSFGPLPAFAWPLLRRGVPAFPDRSATIIYVVPGVDLLLPDLPAVRLTLRGPGIETEQCLAVSGLAASEFAMLAEVNQDFPLGVDTILTDASGRLACIPRSSTIAISTVAGKDA
jgi:alpha-D-ribose 1-methylphosphonate 5-triphosphate synthase subunit PhnH